MEAINEMKKANIGVQTFFYILMGIIMVTIIIFGYNKFIGVQDQLSEGERLEIRNNLQDTLTYCSNPLNKGSKRTVNLKSAKVNGMCFITPDISEYPQLEAIAETGDNVILIKGDKDGDKVINIQVIDSFKFEEDFDDTYCQIDEVTITC